MIALEAAERLLDFGASIGAGPRAREQLEGAVALHDILTRRRVAYLADEVGMGKTYVALGALALFRHFDPGTRVLVIAPRENIQTKWMKEMRNFVAHNVRFADLRVKSLDGRPARPLVSCRNLQELVQEVVLNPNRDFFLRLSSFSLPIAGGDAVDPDAARRLRDGLRRSLPWLRDEVFDLRQRQAFKDNVARAVCCALPVFDLVIIDEAHNLKHGWSEKGASRNRVLALALGHPEVPADRRLFPGYGPRAGRVLMLSATPIEETYAHLWNQLGVFARQEGFEGLRDQGLEEARKKELAAKFLIRRVTSIDVQGRTLTKNLYRRDWRQGGVHHHDEPIRIEDVRQRLIVALVQKKVAELLGHERFNSSFQVGMLASFESFLETAKVKRTDPDPSNFDDPEQTEKTDERLGIDVKDVNSLARSYREKFDTELPHPKMDAVVDSLADAWRRGRKALVFVRRIASVKELKRKLDERYDAWLLGHLRRELPPAALPRFERTVELYREEKKDVLARAPEEAAGPDAEDDVDHGGSDTFFAWFFRGDGPRGVISGANIQQRFVQRGAVYSTFFEDNHVARLLDCRPGQVETTLSEELGMDAPSLRSELRQRSRRFLSRAKKHARADRFEAVQAAAIELLKDRAGAHQERARIVWHQRFESSAPRLAASEAPEIGDWLETRTFFTELCERPALRARLWPAPTQADPVAAFRERELRAQLLAAAARLGHSLIGLYLLTIRRLGSLELRTQESQEDEGPDRGADAINEYLDLLHHQSNVPLEQRDWGAFDELSDIARHLDLILSVNLPEARTQPLAETTRAFGQLLRQQRPVGGMSGQVNATLVRQFRMPGYPLVLISTDLLQEGEDLHTFCSSVHHYGISWTPSAMEQRIGRIDRVRSQTDRRLGGLDHAPCGGELLQVYFPYLEDTVEVLQVQRVLERMNTFLRLMHEGLSAPAAEQTRIDIGKELARGRRVVPQILEQLQSAFPIREEHLQGRVTDLEVQAEASRGLLVRFEALRALPLEGVTVEWEESRTEGALLGTAIVGSRRQPFTLILESLQSKALVHCVSPVGWVNIAQAQDEIAASVARQAARLGAMPSRAEGSYDLTVEDEVLLAPGSESDAARVGMLIARVVDSADRLEIEHIPGHDEPLETFRKQLGEEAGGDG